MNDPSEIRPWDYFCDSAGKEWRVKRAWKHKVILTATRHEAPDRESSRTEIAASYVKAVLPHKLAVGQVLYCGGHRCVVDGFTNEFGGVHMVLLSGDWGFGGDHTHQNAIPCYMDHLSASAVRLPYPCEKEIAP
jgi:hypothetical protein